MANSPKDPQNLIAIVGISGRFPGADTVDQFWENLCSGKDTISRYLQDGANDPSRVLAGGFLKNIEYFDAGFFHLSPKEASITDPQHRLFLEICWEALENAGYVPEKYQGSIGVFASCGPTDYLDNNLRGNRSTLKTSEQLLNIGNQKDYFSTKVAYKFNLTGPCITIQTACSSSLVAVVTACTHLLTFQCDMALAGGMSIALPQGQGYHYQEGMIFSPDGYCRPFDASGQGTVPSNGGGAILLKRYEDAIADRDTIHALIRGYGINNDGLDKVSFSAPSISGQAAAIQIALEMADINPETISYIETHGTGTKLGDPIEIEALTRAFGSYTDKKQFCAIGSVKGNIGHLLESAGIAGLIKMALAFKAKEIPKTIHFEEPNPEIDFENSPFYVASTPRKWKSTSEILRAGVSSFGMGGTNAHVILEEHVDSQDERTESSYEVFPISAKTPESLRKNILNLKQYLEKNKNINLKDVAFTLQYGRKDCDQRAIFFGKSVEEVLRSIDENINSQFLFNNTLGKKPFLVFFCSQCAIPDLRSSSSLYNNIPNYKNWIDSGLELAKELTGVDFKAKLKKKNEWNDKEHHILNVIAQYALARTLSDANIKPDMVISIGAGELSGLCISGMLSLHQAINYLLEMADPLQAEDQTITPLYSLDRQSWITPETIPKKINLQRKNSRNQHVFANVDFPQDDFKMFIEITPAFMISKINEQKQIERTDKDSISEIQSFGDLLGQFWLNGALPDWQIYKGNIKNKRIPLPTYAFERQKYWIDPAPEDSQYPKSLHESDFPKIKMNKASIEKSLSEIWKSLLGGNTPQPSDNFFNLGGDSLMALELASYIHEKFQVDLKMADLIKFPTLSQQIDEIYRLRTLKRDTIHNDTSSSNLIVPLKEGVGENPLFIIHQIDGHVLQYKALADCINYAGPIYGIQSIDARGSAQGITIEDLANSYIGEIQRLGIPPPYRLLGASMGGLIAYEMAVQLKSKSQAVDFLAMIDSIPPDSNLKGSNSDIEMIALLLELFENKKINHKKLASLSEKEQIERLMKGMNLEKFPKDEKKKLFEEIRRNWNALKSYILKPYEGKILLIEAGKNRKRLDGKPARDAWEAVAKNITFYEVQADHQNIIKQPGVKEVASIIDDFNRK